MRTSRSRNDGDAAAGEALAATLAYAGRGWPVFPCRGKRPHVKNGLHDAATDRLTVERWWTRIWPGANVAIRAGSESGLLVLDVDGEAGADALAALEREHAELGATVECLTGGGGRHLYFAHPGGELRNSAGRLAPGLDVRGDGGYVIAPPSRHSSGGRYEWSVDGHPDELEPAQAPAWLLEGLRAHRAACGRSDPRGGPQRRARVARRHDAPPRDGRGRHPRRAQGDQPAPLPAAARRGGGRIDSREHHPLPAPTRRPRAHPAGRGRARGRAVRLGRRERPRALRAARPAAVG
jgi:Bifunctional DNA primase/polymerase, N-terminal